MAKLGRHSPTIVNAAWGAIFMWDGRLATLEEQALGPIQAAGEMNMPLEQLMERLTSIGEYKPLFARAFPDEGMSAKTLAKAIATYERTVVSERAPFDSWIEEMKRRFPRKPSAALPSSTARRSVLPAMRAGTSPMTASRTSGCRARTSAAANSCRA
jgi:cytochrome c peroxidase